MRRALILALILSVSWMPVRAGQDCTEKPPTADGMNRALELATQVQRGLDRRQAQAAILARAGSDVSRYGLRYTHAALVYRAPDTGRWTVLHKLNHCGREDADLFSQGLANFFLEDPWEYRALILVPHAPLQAHLLAQAAHDQGQSVHQPRYSLLAYPFAPDYQNSNGWLLEFIELAQAGGTIIGRKAIQATLRENGYRPDRIEVGPIERIGASLFKANVSFLDHPLGERLSGRYSVVTVESMVRYLGERGQIDALDEVALNRAPVE